MTQSIDRFGLPLTTPPRSFDSTREYEVLSRQPAIPSVAMFLTVLAVNFVGDHLRGRFFDLRQASI